MAVSSGRAHMYSERNGGDDGPFSDEVFGVLIDICSIPESAASVINLSQELYARRKPGQSKSAPGILRMQGCV